MTLGRLARLALLAVAGAGCSPEPAPRWISLAAGFRPDPGPGPPEAGEVRSSSFVEEGGDIWVQAELERARWGAGPWTDFWQTRMPLSMGVRRTRSLEVRLEADGRTFQRRDVPKWEHAQLAAGEFLLAKESLFLRLGPGETPPEGMRFAFRSPFGESRDGSWRVILGGISAEGLPAVPGRTERVVADIPPASALRFATASRRFDPDGQGSELVWRLDLNGETLFEHRALATLDPEPQWHTVPLPPGGERGARFEFRVEGELGLGAWLTPTLGPLERGRWGQRPWSGGRRDAVLFLADTFRADNLRGYGAGEEWSPALDRLLEDSACFVRSWAPASWTLPSQVSMFTGVYPPQHGAVRPRYGIPSQLVTLAEHLSAFGYRTGAITDSGFVSRVYDFDRGFEWFLELPERQLSRTFELAERFMEADDGRPAFLFIQTYRTHVPYRTGSEEEEERYRDILRRYDLSTELANGAEAADGVPVEAAAELFELYRDCARDLDRKLGAWCQGLSEQGFFREGVFALTSDHGEAFLEHGELGHGKTPWEEKIRIPLFFHGADLPGRLHRQAASLVDVPRTLAGLIGVPPAGGWGGRDLFRAQADVPVFAFDGNEVAVVSGDRKLLGRLQGDGVEILAAFDLATDPGEQADLTGEAAALEASIEGRLKELREPLVEAAAIQVGDDARAQLRALGYVDE